MKELSVEEKAKRYDNIIEKANKMHSENCEACQACIEELIPELAESEDEKIKKSLIDMLKNDEKCYLKEIAWLEEQGQHKKFRDSIQVGDKVTRNEDGVLVNLSQLKRVAKKDEKQDEQEPDDKVKRKGMNLVEEEMTPFQKKVFCIIDTTIEEERGLKQVCGELLRLAHDEIMQNPAVWSSEQSKTLQTNDVPNESSTDAHLWTRAICFDGEPMESKPCEQKPAWSEEDEKNINELIRLMEQLRSKYVSESHCYPSWGKLVNWLKSLKPQNTWKPSEEQMKALNEAIYHVDDSIATQIAMLIGDLKKL